ncbi:hypothetical protein Q6A87_08560 [Aliarcobacter skirrowii]|uniref:hypothetical protein n=1 Tax=Aliarcobacter skirrowii TaxID=28200 RepID=UPI0029A8F677|nr:hypothetical protein [Aliarcobacter skirrowii]MDX4067899.1 hypothetical protein [Aliarcobacter skirrowii]
MFELNFKHKIIIEDVPLQWMTRLELFTPDLEQFPLMYIHKLINKEDYLTVIGNYNPLNKQRIFGFVLSANWSEIKQNKLCDVEISFLCNIPQNFCINYDNLIKNEISNRIGFADKVSRDDLAIICENSPQVLSLLQKIWDDKINVVYGDYIPHGRLFEEVYGIVRFSASGNAPKLGKISEFRMLYWYMKDIGEKVTFGQNLNQFNFLEFYLLPTYEELLNTNFVFFDNFNEYFTATNSFWNSEYISTFQINTNTFNFAPTNTKTNKYLPISANDFESKFPNILNPNEYDKISNLRQIFNRMPGRLYGYIWNIMTPTTVDFYNAFAQRDSFKEFYRDYSSKKGLSTKVIACFLQQAFGLEAFPIDTWVKTFIYYPLGMNTLDNGKGEVSRDTQNNLYSNFNRLDKLEKLIWASSMGNKTNKTEFVDILWCQRYGTDEGGGGSCRGANPLSCANCSLRDECISYQSIKNTNIIINDNLNQLKLQMINNQTFFGVLTDNHTPRKVYTLKRNDIELRDSHSGLTLSSNISIPNGTYNINAFISLL